MLAEMGQHRNHASLHDGFSAALVAGQMVQAPHGQPLLQPRACAGQQGHQDVQSPALNQLEEVSSRQLRVNRAAQD